MFIAKRRALMFAACALGAGCSSVPPTQIVETGLCVTSPNLVTPTGKRSSTLYSSNGVVGTEQAFVPDLIALRECDASGSHCVEGVAKAVVSIAVQKLDGDKATLSVSVSYDAGRRQSIESKTPASTMPASRDIDAGADAILQHTSFSKSAVIKLGQMRQVRLPNDVRLQVCVALPDANGFPAPGRCDFTAIQFDRRVEDPVSPL
jgi:hypothetical protein